jgi:hypothetical protein
MGVPEVNEPSAEKVAYRVPACCVNGDRFRTEIVLRDACRDRFAFHIKCSVDTRCVYNFFPTDMESRWDSNANGYRRGIAMGFECKWLPTWNPDGIRMLMDTDVGFQWGSNANGYRHEIPMGCECKWIPTWDPNWIRMQMATGMGSRRDQMHCVDPDGIQCIASIPMGSSALCTDPARRIAGNFSRRPFSGPLCRR